MQQTVCQKKKKNTMHSAHTKANTEKLKIAFSDETARLKLSPIQIRDKRRIFMQMNC